MEFLKSFLDVDYFGFILYSRMWGEQEQHSNLGKFTYFLVYVQRMFVTATGNTYGNEIIITILFSIVSLN